MGNCIEIKTQEIRCSCNCCDGEVFTIVGGKVVCEDCMNLATLHMVYVTRFEDVTTGAKIGEKID